MNLLEYQGKELFDQYGIRIPSSHLANSIEEAKEGAKKLGYPFVLKSQVTAGGRGKAGAILKCKDESELESKFNEIMNKPVKGQLPKSILLEKMANIKKEIYLSIFLNRTNRAYSIISSSEGGVEIENVENKVIEEIEGEEISKESSEKIGLKLGLKGTELVAYTDILEKLSKVVKEKEAELAEINPLAVLQDDSFLALDSKVIIDDNALFRHPELKKYQNISELEEQAQKHGFSLVELGGPIAIMGNGAGLVMSTLDMVSDAYERQVTGLATSKNINESAGAFLDFGGSATTETIYEALKVISRMKHIKVILVNLFGGIVRTSLVAQAILNAYGDNIIDVPVYARISGAESEKAKEMLLGSKAKIYDTVEYAINSMMNEMFQVK